MGENYPQICAVNILSFVNEIIRILGNLLSLHSYVNVIYLSARILTATPTHSSCRLVLQTLFISLAGRESFTLLCCIHKDT